jgi:LacI family transcriptional regulator
MQKEVEITNLLQNGRVDGIMISLSSKTVDTYHLEQLKEKKIPLVFFDRVAENIDAPKITTDDYNSSFRAIDHLVENGCKRIAFLAISHNLSISNKRMNGYLDALKKHGLKQDDNLIIQCNSEEEKNQQQIRKLLRKKNRPDGIFASVEKLAITSYEICEELKLNIPRILRSSVFPICQQQPC